MDDTTSISLDYSFALAPACQGGITPDTWQSHADLFPTAVSAVRAQVESGALGFWNLPTSPVDDLLEFAAELDDSIRDVLVLGIGGSSLGTRAVMQALAGPGELGFPDAKRRVHLPDNSDPWLLDHLLRTLSPANTIVLAISKSGGTVETAAQMLVVRDWLNQDLGAQARKHLVFVTDPESGTLRKLGNEEGIRCFAIPPNVGGRFSVLTPVGLLPAALAGLDIKSMLNGAQAMAARCASEQLDENPAGVVAVSHYVHHLKLGRPLHVMMPYADQLRPFANWYVQLWAESLGKRTDRTGATVEVGPTPVPAVGATDQHAQMQLFMEGPRDKLVTFVRVASRNCDKKIPNATGPYAYLNGHNLGDVLDAEYRGTRLALADDGRPSITVTLPRVDAASLGGLFFLYEAATAISGELYDINAFDQPGVEAGKRLAFGLLGREGYEAARNEVEQAEARGGTHVLR